MTDVIPDYLSTYQSLTEKQKEVLDLLIQHKTSKEIARTLGISPHTVDQRITFAKRKLDANTRGELASSYRVLKEVCEQTVYQKSDVEPSALLSNDTGTDDASAYLFSIPPTAIKKREEVKDEIDYRVVPEMFEGRAGKKNRIAATVGISVLMLLLGLSGLAIFSTISDLLSG